MENRTEIRKLGMREMVRAAQRKMVSNATVMMQAAEAAAIPAWRHAIRGAAEQVAGLGNQPLTPDLVTAAIVAAESSLDDLPGKSLLYPGRLSRTRVQVAYSVLELGRLLKLTKVEVFGRICGCPLDELDRGSVADRREQAKEKHEESKRLRRLADDLDRGVYAATCDAEQMEEFLALLS